MKHLMLFVLMITGVSAETPPKGSREQFYLKYYNFYRMNHDYVVKVGLSEVPMTVRAGEYVARKKDDRDDAVLRLQYFLGGGFSVYPAKAVRVPESEIQNAAAEFAKAAPQRRRLYDEMLMKRMQAEQPKPQQPPPAQAPPVVSTTTPATITVEPLYTWDVKVWVGRKYQWTKDTYVLFVNRLSAVWWGSLEAGGKWWRAEWGRWKL